MIFGKKRNSSDGNNIPNKTYDMRPDSFLTLPKNVHLLERITSGEDTLNHPMNDLFEEELSSTNGDYSMGRMVAINKQLISFISFFVYGAFVDRKDYMLQLIEIWDKLADFYKAIKPEFDLIDSMCFSQPDVDLSPDTKVYLERFKYFEHCFLTWNEIFLDMKN